MSPSNQFSHSLFTENVFISLSFVKDSFNVYWILGWIWFNRILLLFLILSLWICHFIVFWPPLFQMRSRPLIVSISSLATFSCSLHNFHLSSTTQIFLHSFFSLFRLNHFYQPIFKFTYCFFLNLLFIPCSEFFISIAIYFNSRILI